MKKTCNTTIQALALILLLTSCLCRQEELEDGKMKFGGMSSQLSPIQVTKISVVDDQLVIKGAYLGTAKSVQLRDSSGNQVNFTIESKSASEVVANGMKNFAFAMGKVFDLIISDAYGDAKFNLTFHLPNGSVTANKLHNMNAQPGQVLQYNGAGWGPADLSGLSFQGMWNASTNTPDLSGSGNPGDYYIVSDAGTFDLLGGAGTNSWAPGDWVVWNNNTSHWEKINNNTNVSSFNGRNGVVVPQAGDYTWAQINKTTSSINDIADVDTTGVSAGKILKWDGAKWAISDDLSGGGAGSITSTSVQDGTLTNVDISGTAAIDWGKISKSGATASDVGAAAASLTITAGTGLTGGGDLSTNRTISVDVGTTGNKIVQLDGSGRLPAVDASQLTNVPLTSRWSANGSKIYYNTANVGIGTNDPASKLTVTGVIESTTGGIKYPDGFTQNSRPKSMIHTPLAANYQVPASSTVTIRPGVGTIPHGACYMFPFPVVLRNLYLHYNYWSSQSATGSLTLQIIKCAYSGAIDAGDLEVNLAAGFSSGYDNYSRNTTDTVSLAAGESFYFQLVNTANVPAMPVHSIVIEYDQN